MTTTRPIVPRVNGDSSVGVPDKHWGKSYIDEGHFGSVKLNGGDLGEYLAESTGYGIVSGCAPSISDLTVTVGAGVVHLADGTRKEISSTNITLDNADPTNPRIDLVYITSAGEVAKVTGTAAASPSAPTLPTGGISVAQVSMAAGVTTGTVNRVQTIAPNLANYGIVSVRDFGAVGDGVTDDTAAIQSAIDSGNCIYIPSGEYMVNAVTSIVINKDNTRVILAEDAILKAIPNSAPNYAVIMVNKAKNVVITGGCIIGEKDEHTGSTGEWGYGINFNSAKFSIAEKIKISNFWGDGVYVGCTDKNDETTFSDNISINCCEIFNCRRQGVSVVGGNNTHINDCYIHNIDGTQPQSAIDVEPNGTVKCAGTIISKCVMENNSGFDILVAGNEEKVLINNCILKSGLSLRSANADNDIEVNSCNIEGTITNNMGRILFQSSTLGNSNEITNIKGDLSNNANVTLTFIGCEFYNERIVDSITSLIITNSSLKYHSAGTILPIINIANSKNITIKANDFYGNVTAIEALIRATPTTGEINQIIIKDNVINIPYAISGGGNWLMLLTASFAEISNNTILMDAYNHNMINIANGVVDLIVKSNIVKRTAGNLLNAVTGSRTNVQTDNTMITVS